MHSFVKVFRYLKKVEKRTKFIKNNSKHYNKRVPLFPESIKDLFKFVLLAL